MQQQTLTGETTEDTRSIPDTFLYCEECDQAILRSERARHEHRINTDDSGMTPRIKESVEKVPELAVRETQNYVVTFHDEYIEEVRVEAESKLEAKEIADEKRSNRTYDGEFIDTMHTEYREIGEPGQATIDYLEMFGLLPEDHDVTAADIQRVINYDEK